ncbi:MAG: methylated-DNA--[protein]-cysteine S-methyltransferase [Betaproteobacteria bacterium]|nr:methylated-DNA--[protein]-cysteine S-methyltransferase [Betaproteobacteria bacterium]
MNTNSAHLYQACLKTPCATLGLISDANHLLGIHILPLSVAAQAPQRNTIAHLAAVQLMAYFDNSAYRFDLPIKLAGSKHQLDVWNAMCTIPQGKTWTYGQLAEAVGSNARAVGTACGRNPLPIVVPCHRIVASNGLGGFMGGKESDPLAVKRWLLTHEGALPPSLL